MNEVFGFIGLPPSDLENLEARNTRAYEGMSETAKEKLNDFYAPYNEMLSELLLQLTGKPLDVANW